MNYENTPTPASTCEHTERNFRHFTLYKDKPLDSIRHPIPVLIVPGFASSAESFALLAKTLNEHGFTTIRIEYEFGRPGEPKKWLVLPDVDRLKRESIIAAIQAEGKSLNEDGPKQVITLTHSKGAMDVAQVAADNPEFFQGQIIFMDAPSNLRPRPSLVDAIRMLRNSNCQDKLDKAKLAAERGEIVAELVRANDAYAHRYGGIHRLMDIASSAWGSVYDILPKLTEKRIGTIVIAHTEDAFNSVKSFTVVQKRVGGIIAYPGIHSAIKFSPEECERIAQLLEQHEPVAA